VRARDKRVIDGRLAEQDPETAYDADAIYLAEPKQTSLDEGEAALHVQRKALRSGSGPKADVSNQRV